MPAKTSCDSLSHDLYEARKGVRRGKLASGKRLNAKEVQHRKIATIGRAAQAEEHRERDEEDEEAPEFVYIPPLETKENQLLGLLRWEALRVYAYKLTDDGKRYIFWRRREREAFFLN